MIAQKQDLATIPHFDLEKTIENLATLSSASTGSPCKAGWGQSFLAIPNAHAMPNLAGAGF
jgi:hypothetical protein